jgi:hypothetical protein
MVKNLTFMVGWRRSASFVYDFREALMFEIFADPHDARRK